ncbi:hypothetical protein A7A08_00633 [Methyloligella halotolerans]|uniref:Uncharacterized protein n=1 Tax=Methyloligella halotolerans TaxID=1177755 RepID=A0A1E2S396_9HYPH|nr:DUF447 domain-containing protein [Methyloligella halotolerans]ODA68799.1 hypothetical protein A7A08_00633 [Methyloligella halotolerans]
MPMIRECIVTTMSGGGEVHVAPLGIIADDDNWIIAPFHPSTTLENLRENPHAVANFTDDVLVFAGCLTGRKEWPTVPAEAVPGARLAETLAHAELAVESISEDELRPRFSCRVVKTVNHAPFGGMNRAKSAVLEAAILASRLKMLPREKVEQEIGYLTIAIEKTAGPREQEAWDMLMAKIDAFYKDAAQ